MIVVRLQGPRNTFSLLDSEYVAGLEVVTPWLFHPRLLLRTR